MNEQHLQLQHPCFARYRTRHTGNSKEFSEIRALKNTESVTVGPRSGANSQFCTYINHRVKIKYIQKINYQTDRRLVLSTLQSNTIYPVLSCPMTNRCY